MNAAAPLACLLIALSLSTPAAHGSAPLQAVPPSGTCFGLNHVNDTSIPRVIASMRVAVIEPVLTSTPYSQYDYGSFYAFYAKEAGVTSNVTANLDLLSTNVSSGYGFNNGWGLSSGMHTFITSQTAADCGLVLGKNVQVLTDMDVANGGLFYPNGTSRFDAVILPFSEYVEAQEYAAYESFVGGGGTLVLMAHSLEYPVTYNATSKMETLVYGHGWYYDGGKYAYSIPCASDVYDTTCPWAASNNDWVGSNTCEAGCFHTFVYNGSRVLTTSPVGRALDAEFGQTVFQSYKAHEEDTVTNMTDTSIVSVFLNDSQYLIASYTHHYQRGNVVGFGYFGDDIIATDPSAQYFLLQGVAYGRLAPAPPLTSSASTQTASTTNLDRTQTTTTGRIVNTTVISPPSTTTSIVTYVPGPEQPAYWGWIALPVLLAVVAVVAVVLLRRKPQEAGPSSASYPTRSTSGRP